MTTTVDSGVESAVDSFFTANPNASTADVASAVTAAGGMTPEIAQALAAHYGTDVATVQSAYNNYVASEPSSTTQTSDASPTVQEQTVSDTPVIQTPTSSSPLSNVATTINGNDTTDSNLSSGSTGNLTTSANTSTSLPSADALNAITTAYQTGLSTGDMSAVNNLIQQNQFTSADLAQTDPNFDQSVLSGQGVNLYSPTTTSNSPLTSVNQNTSASTPTTTPTIGSAYFAANPDVAAAYAQNSMGMTPDEYAQMSYNMYGAGSGLNSPQSDLNSAQGITQISGTDITSTRGTEDNPQLANIINTLSATPQLTVSDAGYGQVNYSIDLSDPSSQMLSRLYGGTTNVPVTEVSPGVFQVTANADGGGGLAYTFTADPTTGQITSLPTPNANAVQYVPGQGGGATGGVLPFILSTDPVTAPFSSAYNIANNVANGQPITGATVLGAVNAASGILNSPLTSSAANAVGVNLPTGTSTGQIISNATGIDQSTVNSALQTAKTASQIGSIANALQTGNTGELVNSAIGLANTGLGSSNTSSSSTSPLTQDQPGSNLVNTSYDDGSSQLGQDPNLLTVGAQSSYPQGTTPATSLLQNYLNATQPMQLGDVTSSQYPSAQVQAAQAYINSGGDPSNYSAFTDFLTNYDPNSANQSQAGNGATASDQTSETVGQNSGTGGDTSGSGQGANTGFGNTQGSGSGDGTGAGGTGGGATTAGTGNQGYGGVGTGSAGLGSGASSTATNTGLGGGSSGSGNDNNVETTSSTDESGVTTITSVDKTTGATSSSAVDQNNNIVTNTTEDPSNNTKTVNVNDYNNGTSTTTTTDLSTGQTTTQVTQLGGDNSGSSGESISPLTGINLASSSSNTSGKPDVPTEVPPSVTPEVPPEVSPDVPPDVPPSVPPSVPPDVPPEVPPDVPPEVPPDVPPEVLSVPTVVSTVNQPVVSTDPNTGIKTSTTLEDNNDVTQVVNDPVLQTQEITTTSPDGSQVVETTDKVTGLYTVDTYDAEGNLVSSNSSPSDDNSDVQLNPVTVTGGGVDTNTADLSTLPSVTLPDSTVVNLPDVTPPVVSPPVVTPPVVSPPVVTPPVVSPPVVTPPTTTSPLTLPTTKVPTAQSPQTTQTSSSPFIDKALPMVATMLAGAPVYGKDQGMAQLRQIYDNLDPQLAKVLQQSGVLPPEPPKEVAKSEEPTQAELDQANAELKAEQPETAENFLFAAEGGSTFSDLVKNTEYKNIAPVAPTMLKAAPVTQQESRISPLHYLKQGIRKDAPSTSMLARGGLPHKYREAAPDGHHPEFITGLTGYYASGKGTGQSDDIPAMLHDGDYVMDADTVASLGDGSSKAGSEVLTKFHHEIPHKMSVGGNPVPAKIADGEYVFPASFVTALGGGDNKLGSKLLDTMREELRAHKRSAPDTKIPPKAKSPLEYLKMAKG